MMIFPHKTHICRTTYSSNSGGIHVRLLTESRVITEGPGPLDADDRDRLSTSFLRILRS